MGNTGACPFPIGRTRLGSSGRLRLRSLRPTGRMALDLWWVNGVVRGRDLDLDADLGSGLGCEYGYETGSGNVDVCSAVVV